MRLFEEITEVVKKSETIYNDWKNIYRKIFQRMHRYCLEDKEQKEEEKMIVKNCAELSKPVLHISLSLAPEENFQKPH